jgi:hypothetical protein
MPDVTDRFCNATELLPDRVSLLEFRLTITSRVGREPEEFSAWLIDKLPFATMVFSRECFLVGRSITCKGCI